jgi:hypothetical protein
MGGSNDFHWKRGLLCGVFWCIGVTVIDGLTLPVGDMSWRDTTSLLIVSSLANLGSGLVWTLGVEWTGLRGRPLLKFAILLPVAVVVSATMVKVPVQGLIEFSRSMARLISIVPLMDVACRTLWPNILYGGGYFLGYHITARTMQLRRGLSELRLIRGEADMRFRETRLQAYRGQIRPTTLLEALKALQIRYATDRRTGDELFDRLIAFLRAAMPGLRGGLSTLSAELAIIQTYAVLCNMLRNGSPRWRVEMTPHHSKPTSVPFRLLASLDTIDRYVPPDQVIEIRTSFLSGIFGILVSADTSYLDDAASQRLRHDLEFALGGDAIVAVEPRGYLSLDLRLPASAVEQGR